MMGDGDGDDGDMMVGWCIEGVGTVGSVVDLAAT